MTDDERRAHNAPIPLPDECEFALLIRPRGGRQTARREPPGEGRPGRVPGRDPVRDPEPDRTQAP